MWYSEIMNRFLPILFLVGFGVWCLGFNSGVSFFPSFHILVDQAYADEVEDLQKQIDELAKLKKLSEDATKPLESQVKDLESKIKNAQNGIASAKKKATELSTSIDTREKDLAKQYEILSVRVAEQYKKARMYSPLLLIVSTNDAAHITKDLAYRSSVKAQDNKLIQDIGSEILTLENDKKKLEQDQIRLASLQKQLDEQQSFFEKEVAKAKSYQTELSGKIADLSAKQQEIINAKSGGFITSVGDGELADEYYSSIRGFREQAPGGYFAVFSFGAYTHRNGMSQYGARGRAAQGQNYRQILQAYYNREPVSKDTGGNINVQGFGSLNFEDYYLMGIAEMPSSWSKEALKAQAIAARTYAYRYKVEGSTICTTEACQVFNNSKAANPPQSWREAVQETRGQVLEGVSSQYASTHGGFTNTSGWDTTDGSGGGNFIDKAWDKVGGSPWLYKAWWRQGYSASGATCGRNNPWLSPQEMADIVNAHVVLKRGTSEEVARVTPVTTSCWGGNPYSVDELRNVASRYGGIDSANSVSVTQGNGTTATVTINGVSMSGSDFKQAFNVRASGYMRIPQSGFAFFNVEKK